MYCMYIFLKLKKYIQKIYNSTGREPEKFENYNEYGNGDNNLITEPATSKKAKKYILECIEHFLSKN